MKKRIVFCPRERLDWSMALAGTAVKYHCRSSRHALGAVVEYDLRPREPPKEIFDGDGPCTLAYPSSSII